MMEKISIIVPAYNEGENLEALLSSLTRTMEAAGEVYEIVVVDDGSNDGSQGLLRSAAESDPRIRVIEFRRNFGQTAAMAAGFDFASGSIVIAIDADLQNDPADIPEILSKLREGYDVVSCWRRNRKDALLTRVIPSRLANLIISTISGVRLHDYGCTLKGYRRDVLQHVRLYGEMHRFIPIYASWAGARVTEISVHHNPRRRGTSKYGVSRTYKVILDLITVKMLVSYSTKPMYFFGSIGLAACAGGVLFAGWTLLDRFLNDVRAHRNPLLLLAVFLFILGVQFILMGVVAELLIRTYFESQGKTPYVIRKTWNCPEHRADNSNGTGPPGPKER